MKRKKNSSDKRTTNERLDQPSSEKLPLTKDKSKYREPQPDNMQRVKYLGTLNTKQDVFFKSLPS